MNPLLIILGPTASGKTRLATRVADRLGGEIISADSRQVYRNMDIGTGKDLEEYMVDGRQIKHHLINIREAGEQYNVNDYQQDFKSAAESISSRNAVPVVCGGTGFYIYSVLKGHAFSSIPVDENLRHLLESLSNDALQEKFNNYSSVYQDLADTSTRKRLVRAIEISEFLIQNPTAASSLFKQNSQYRSLVFGLNPPVDTRRQRISERLKFRLKNGLVEEVQSLLESGLTPEQLIYYGLEYKYLTLYLTQNIKYEEMYARLETDIHRFAKRQMTFFRKMERDGITIKWVDMNASFDRQIQTVATDYNDFLLNVNL